MKQTFTVLVYLKTSKINSKGMAPICIRVTVNGKRSEISIKQFIEPSRWNSNRQRLTGTSYRVRTINKSIELSINRINDIHNDLIQNNKLVTAKAITNKYLGRDQPSFLTPNPFLYIYFPYSIIMKTQPKTYFVLFSVISVLFLLLYLIDKTQTNHLAMFFANFTFAAYFFKKSKKK